MNPKKLKSILADYESHLGDPLDTDEPRVAAVKRIIDGLPRAERTVFLLHVDGYSFREMEKLLKVSREPLRKYYNAILDKIRNELEKCQLL